MTHDLRIIVGIALAVSLVTYVVFLFPALTTSEAPGRTETSQVAFETLVQSERDYCESEVDNVNCRCFGDVSGLILSDTSPRVPRAEYAEKRELARGQAADKC